MSNPRDVDLFYRSLTGDWRSRVSLFKKFIWENTRVHRLKPASQQMDNFLHDCFTNVMATGHSFDPEENLNSWVESVATWTALDRQRLRANDKSGVPGSIRLCAATEGDEPNNRGRLTSYVPPRSSPTDSLASRIAALIGESQFTLLANRAIEDNTWEYVAQTTGRPLNSVGPVAAKAVTRLARFFGAPPPLNADLESVFDWLVRKEPAATTKVDPAQPLGRITSMQLDPAFYSVTPDMRKIGVSLPSDARTIILWDAARASTPPGEALRDHLAKCHYCTDLLRAMLLMQQALQSGPDADFLLCPGGFTLVNASDLNTAEFDQHLEACSLCREEHNRITGAVEQNAAPGSPEEATQGSGTKRSKKQMVWTAAIAAFVLTGIFVGYQLYHAVKNQPVADIPVTVVAAPAPVVAVNPRYKDLAQNISVTDVKWLASVLPKNQRSFAVMIEELQNGRPGDAQLLASGLAEKDPGVQMLYSFIQYQRNSVSEGYRAMLRSEEMSPRNSFRCWAALQCAIIVGDMTVVNREVEHLSADPQYAARARDLLARVRARG